MDGFAELGNHDGPAQRDKLIAAWLGGVLLAGGVVDVRDPAFRRLGSFRAVVSLRGQSHLKLPQQWASICPVAAGAE
ncbi:hypothetical protein D3C77_768060 [compost metagenome]